MYGRTRDRWRKYAKFVVSCQAESGGFSNASGLPLTTETTYCGVRCVDLLVGWTSTETTTTPRLFVKGFSPANAIDWILSCQVNTRVFGGMPGTSPRVSDCRSGPTTAELYLARCGAFASLTRETYFPNVPLALALAFLISVDFRAIFRLAMLRGRPHRNNCPNCLYFTSTVRKRNRKLMKVDRSRQVVHIIGNKAVPKLPMTHIR